MQDVVAGINEEGLGTLSLEILDYVDRISKIFDKIDASMDRLKLCYRGPSCDKIISCYGMMQELYPVIKGNIKSYSDDLILVIRKMKEGDEELSKSIQRMSDEYRSRIKKINNKI